MGGDTAIKTVSIGYMVRAPTFALPIPLRALPVQPPFLMRAAFFMHKNTNTKIQEPQSGRKEFYMAFFNSAVGVLQTLVIALGAGLGIWGVINLLEGYGNDNPGANAHVR